MRESTNQRFGDSAIRRLGIGSALMAAILGLLSRRDPALAKPDELVFELA